MRAIALLPVVALLAATACDSSPRHVRFTARDSAGIVIAGNEAIGTAPVLWNATEETSIGASEGPPEMLFGYIADVAVDAAGRIHALDQQANEVRVFDGAGRFLRRIGRPGKGPGELSRFANAVLVAADGTILVPDYAQARLTVYDSTGAVLRTLPISTQPGGRSWSLEPDGQLLYRGITLSRDAERNFVTWDALLRARPGAATVDTLLVFDYEHTPIGGGAGGLRIPLLINSVFWTRLDDGRVAWSSLDQPAVRIHAPDGRLERIVRHAAWTRTPMTVHDHAELREKFRERMHAVGGSRDVADFPNIDLPAAFPALTDVRAGPGSTLWVQRAGRVADVDFMALNSQDLPQGFGGGHWDVLDGEGRVLGAVTLPPRFRLYELHADRAYGAVTDSLGVQRILVLRLTEPAGGR